MARPREFDEAEVLDRAIRLFWERGYDATSLADIESATGLGRASIYAAFGDKEGLFVKALLRFRERYSDYADRLAEGATAREGFARLLDAWFDANCASAGPRGCMLQQAAASGAGELHRAKALVQETLQSTEALFRNALERARAAGELGPDASPRVLARYLAVGLQGLSSAARAGQSRRELEPVAGLLLDTVFGPRA